MNRTERSKLSPPRLRSNGHRAALALLLASLLGSCSSDGGGPGGEADDDGPDTVVPEDDDDDDGDDDDTQGTERDAARDGTTKDGGRDGATSAMAGDAARDGSTKAVDGARPRPGSPEAGAPPASDASVPSGPPPAGSVCARWVADRANLSEGTWTGNAATCEAGDMSVEARANALRSLNLYRFLAGLAPVNADAEYNRLAQACALMMKANGTITHTPPMDWKCYTADGAKAAGTSSVSSAPGVSSVDAYMIDPGNPTTIGHRRWILSNWLTGVGFGSADRFSCQYQPSRQSAGGKPWIAWPSPGQMPLQALVQGRRGSVDQTGWTIQSDSINLMSAQVTVTSSGVDKPVVVTQLMPGYGSRYALRFNPSGWTTEAGATYSVKVSGTSMPIEYQVEVVNCM
jgi:uncharacterized protein YkwD